MGWYWRGFASGVADLDNGSAAQIILGLPFHGMSLGAVTVVEMGCSH